MPQGRGVGRSPPATGAQRGARRALLLLFSSSSHSAPLPPPPSLPCFQAAGQAGALWRPLAPMEGRPAGPTPPRGAELRRTIAEQLGVLEDLVLGARPSRGAPGPAALQRRPRTAPCPRCAHVDIPAAVAVHQDGRPRARGARRPGATDGVGRGPRGRPG
ncbi:unnamed protein product, partial [Prorocentrum cordatum]